MTFSRTRAAAAVTVALAGLALPTAATLTTPAAAAPVRCAPERQAVADAVTAAAGPKADYQQAQADVVTTRDAYLTNRTTATKRAFYAAVETRTQTKAAYATVKQTLNTAVAARTACLAPQPTLSASNVRFSNYWNSGIAGDLTITGLAPNTTYLLNPVAWCGGEDPNCVDSWTTDNTGSFTTTVTTQFGSDYSTTGWPLGQCGASATDQIVYLASDSSEAARLSIPLPANVPGC